MHPLTRSPRHFFILGLLWSPLCLGAIVIHKNLTDVSWGESALLIVPPLAVQLFICLSLWYICRVIRLDRRYPFKRLAIHILTLAIINGVWLFFILVYSQVLDLVFKTTIWVDLFVQSVPIFLGLGVSLYFIWVLVYYLILANEEIRVGEQEVLKQRLFASQAELRALKATIHPHFLFNSLNMIGPLIHQSPRQARVFVSQLTDFLLYSLQYGKRQRVTVQDELDHITNYLAIEEVRLGERLKLALHAEPTVLRCSILPLTLLPLVENAVKHGIGQCLEGGTLSISIRPDSGFLWVEVKNPIEKPVRPVRGDGLGLETLKKRIEVYYGPAGRVTVDRGEETFNVKLRLPLNREAEDEN